MDHSLWVLILPGILLGLYAQIKLSAAALTYVAAMIQSALELLRFVMIARNNSRN